MSQATRFGEGFSLIEIMVALGLLAFGVLAMLLVQGQSLREGSKGKHTSAAAAVARDHFERIPRMPFSGTELDVMPGGGTAGPVVFENPPWIPTLSGHQTGEVVEEINVEDGTADGADREEQVFRVWYRVTADAASVPNPDIKNVELEVTWEEDGVPNTRPTRTGQPTVAFSGIIVNNDR